MEIIRTDIPVMKDRSKITREIATFWNKTSEGFQTVWGPHIHHGYFEDHKETPVEAQEKLIEKLVELLEISSPDKVLDVGCGMGSSSIYLANKFHVDVTGITLSPRQVEIATQAARKEQQDKVTFKVEDALSLASFADYSFDLVWSLESCEQFYDKSLFLQQAFRVLKPGGSLMLATWCSGADEYKGVEAKKYIKLCRAFQLPCMPTIMRYVQLLQQQGFVIKNVLNWSENVWESWKIGRDNMRAHSFFKIFELSGWQGLLFMKNAKLMQQGFEEGRIEYGVFSACKPLLAYKATA